MTATRPLAYGYLRLPAHADADSDRTYVNEARAQLVAVAQREGLTLAAVLYENRMSDQRAFYAMVERVRRDQVRRHVRAVRDELGEAWVKPFAGPGYVPSLCERHHAPHARRRSTGRTGILTGSLRQVRAAHHRCHTHRR